MREVVGRPITVDQATAHLRDGRVICDRVTSEAIRILLTTLDLTSGGLEATRRTLIVLREALAPMCPCDPNPETTDGAQPECPLHGDPVLVAKLLRESGAVRAYHWHIVQRKQQAQP